VPELVADRATGLLVAPRDTGGMAAALGELADDAATRERLGRAAAGNAARFDVSRMVAAYRALYEELARTRPTTAERAG
jgi:glycosyltransferase involved in cell wall biosynthesis